MKQWPDHAITKQTSKLQSLFGSTKEEAHQAIQIYETLRQYGKQFYGQTPVETANTLEDNIALINDVATSFAVENHFTCLSDEQQAWLHKRLTNIIKSHKKRNYNAVDLGLTNQNTLQYRLDPALAILPQQILSDQLKELPQHNTDDNRRIRSYADVLNTRLTAPATHDATLADMHIHIPAINYEGPIHDIPGEEVRQYANNLTNAWTPPNQPRMEQALLDTTVTATPSELFETYRHRLDQREGSERTIHADLTSRIAHLLTNKKGSKAIMQRYNPQTKQRQRQLASREVLRNEFYDETINVEEGIERAREILDAQEARARTKAHQSNGQKRREGEQQLWSITRRREALESQTPYLHNTFDKTPIRELLRPGPDMYDTLYN